MSTLEEMSQEMADTINRHTDAKLKELSDLRAECLRWRTEAESAHRNANWAISDLAFVLEAIPQAMLDAALHGIPPVPVSDERTAARGAALLIMEHRLKLAALARDQIVALLQGHRKMRAIRESPEHREATVDAARNGG